MPKARAKKKSVPVVEEPETNLPQLISVQSCDPPICLEAIIPEDFHFMPYAFDNGENSDEEFEKYEAKMEEKRQKGEKDFPETFKTGKMSDELKEAFFHTMIEEGICGGARLRLELWPGDAKDVEKLNNKKIYDRMGWKEKHKNFFDDKDYTPEELGWELFAWGPFCLLVSGCYR